MPSKSGETSMAMGTRRRRQRQERLWISHNELAKGPGHPFYQRVNELLEEGKFDAFAERECAKFYAANNGRPSLVPGIYFRLLLIGYFEGVDSERGIAWRAADSIGRRDNGVSYEDFLKGLAKQSGIATPTREDLARLDRTRQKKASNKEWVNPHDADARITKMKDGRTHLAHKAEHAVDLQTGAVLAVTLQEADQGDTTTVVETLVQAGETVAELIRTEAPDQKSQVHLQGIEEVVTDKGYHSGTVLVEMKGAEVRTYIPEKKPKGHRHWEGKRAQQQAVYANRRRVNGAYGKRLLRKRGELIERSFAHCYDTGGMRRTHLRGHQNILKRLLIHVGAFNLSLIFRTLLGSGTPRELRNRPFSFVFILCWLLGRSSASTSRTNSSLSWSRLNRRRNHRYLRYKFRYPRKRGSTTGW